MKTSLDAKKILAQEKALMLRLCLHQIFNKSTCKL
jgi:hypothetical protein